jgi:two-component sensor histidine kinase
MITVAFRARAVPSAVGDARRRTRGLGELSDDALLVVSLVLSELVTNAILHAGLGEEDVIDIVLSREDESVIVVVDDHDGLYGGSGVHPPARRAGGMGLKLLDSLCDSWTAEAGHVIARLSLGHSAAGAADMASRASGPL